jgi:ABC-type antimicrobial peptide transport system permease subunit
LVASLPAGFAPPPDHMFVRFRDDVDHPAAMARLDQQVAAACPCALLPPTKPVDLVNFGRVQYLPAVLAGLVGGLGVLTLGHLIVSATRRRRHELALLQVLGFVPRQIRRAVAWQATITVLIACAVGVPLGIAAGRYAWMRFADQLGIAAPPHVPLLITIALVPLGAVVVGNLAAIVPSRVVVSARPAMILREE